MGATPGDADVPLTNRDGDNSAIPKAKIFVQSQTTMVSSDPRTAVSVAVTIMVVVMIVMVMVMMMMLLTDSSSPKR